VKAIIVVVTWVGSSLFHKHLSRMERLAREKHTLAYHELSKITNVKSFITKTAHLVIIACRNVLITAIETCVTLFD